MKKLIALVLLAMLAVTADAGRKKEKSGVVTEHTFTDSKYGFQMTADDNWGIKTSGPEASVRVIFVQKKFEVPPDYLATPDYTKVPRIVTYIDTTTLGAYAFVDSLISPTYKSKQKSEILKEFELLAERELNARARQPFTLGNDKGVRWDGRAPYLKEVELGGSRTGGKRVRSAYLGSILAIKRGNLIVVFHIMTEEMFFQTVMTEALKIVGSIKWPEEAPAK
ncbi:MAG: hypothetical protein HY851_11625 [candidate division Zixibacteria bacterium]|nr:hypothetical protein [candidate division Zixibacteria bacterium]